MMDFIVLDLRDRIRERENFENRIKQLKTENKNMKRRFKQSSNQIKKDNKVLRKEIKRLTELLEDKMDEKSITEYGDRVKNNEIETFSHDEVKEEISKEDVEEKVEFRIINEEDKRWEMHMGINILNNLLMSNLNPNIKSEQIDFVSMDRFLSELRNEGFLITKIESDDLVNVKIEIQLKENASYRFIILAKSIESFKYLDIESTRLEIEPVN